MRAKPILAISAACLISFATQAYADDHNWYPSKFGADDQAGASNLMTPDKVMQAIKLIKQGKTVSLARTYEAEMPLFGHRVFAVRATNGLAGGPFGENSVIWMDDFLATEIGQVGTQFDGLGHIGIGGDPDRFYNGIPASEAVGPTGMKKLGMEHVKPFFTRGVVLDLKGLKGRSLELGEEVTVKDLQDAMARQKLSAITEGDVVILYTGWSENWIKDNAKFNSGEPGIGMEAAQWLVDQGVAVVGSDAWAVEVVPNPDKNAAFPVHQLLLTKNGIFIHENVASERLVNAGVSEFAYIFNPLAVKGATGSPGNALAAY